MLKQLYLGGALFAAWIAGCSTSPSDDFACVPGQARCACKADHSCNAGLRCNGRDQCVLVSAGSGGTTGGAASGAGKGGTSVDGGTTSQGGTAGGGTANGTGATGGSNGGSTSAGTGGDASNGGGSGGSSTGGSGAEAASDPGTGAAAGASGAGDGGTGATAMGGTGGSTGDPGGDTGTGTTCTELTVESGMDYRNLSNAPDSSAYVYRTSALGMEGPDFFEVEFFASGYDPMNNGEQSGAFTIGEGRDGNLETCSRCVLVNQDVSQGDADVVYFGTSGKIAVGSEEHMTGNPVVDLEDVTLREVTIDRRNRHSMLVPNGRCVHVQSKSVEIPAAWNCELYRYATDDGCDCGCGVRDGDCRSSDPSACDACYCGDGRSSCNALSDTDNAVCN